MCGKFCCTSGDCRVYKFINGRANQTSRFEIFTLNVFGVFFFASTFLGTSFAKGDDESPTNFFEKDLVAGVAVFPERVLESDLFKPLYEFLSKNDSFGTWAEVNQLNAFIKVPGSLNEAMEWQKLVGVIAHVTNPVAMDTLSEISIPSEQGDEIKSSVLNETTVLFGTESMIKSMQSNYQNPSPNWAGNILNKYRDENDLLLVFQMAPIRSIVESLLAPIPPELLQDKNKPAFYLEKIYKTLHSIGVNFNASLSQKLSFHFLFNTETDAIEGRKLLDDFLAGLIVDTQRVIKKHEDFILTNESSNSNFNALYQEIGHRNAESAWIEINETLVELLGLNNIKREGRRIALEMDSEECGEKFQKLIDIWIQSQVAKGRQIAAVNIYMLGQALQNLSFTHGPEQQFDKDLVDEKGNPLLSWRVRILPYLGQKGQEIYKEFNLREPWDSPHNKLLLNQMPKEFRNPDSSAPPNTTTYLMPTGPQCITSGKNKIRLKEIGDALKDTVILVEVNDALAVPWTKPGDWDYDKQEPLAGLGSAHPEESIFEKEFVTLSANFLPKFISANISENDWNAALTIAGNESHQLD